MSNATAHNPNTERKKIKMRFISLIVLSIKCQGADDCRIIS